MLAGWGGGHVDRKVRRVDRRVLRDVSRRQRDDATPSTPPHIPSLWLRRSAADRKSYVGMVRRAVARRQGLGLPLDASEARCRRELGLPADASEADCVAAEVRNAHAAAAP